MRFADVRRIDNKLTDLPRASGDTGQLETVMQLAFGIVAAVALIAIAIAAFNFATAGGDSEKISRSKKAIIYALVGIAVAVFGEAIVFVVVKQL